VRAHLLDAPRPADLVEVAQRLTLLQVDPTAAIAPRRRSPVGRGGRAEKGDGFDGRTARLSPLDRLVHDRVRAQEIFDFEYTLEMCKPAAKRRWGYFALPILHQDRLVGKLDAAADRKASVLRVAAIHEDVKFTRATTNAVRAELEDLAAWLGLASIEHPVRP